MENIIKFYSKSKEAQCLSNFADIEVKIGNIYYQTGEHAYHAMKYKCAAKYATSNDRKQLLLEYSKNFEKGGKYITPLEAKKAGGKKGFALEDHEREKWDNESINVQKEICIYKYTHNGDVKKIIDSSKKSYLLHQDNRATQNTVWGGRIDQKTNELIGQNKLGIIWMDVRSQI